MRGRLGGAQSGAIPEKHKAIDYSYAIARWEFYRESAIRALVIVL